MKRKWTLKNFLPLNRQPEVADAQVKGGRIGLDF